MNPIFHLAIPSHDLGLAKKFYQEGLGASVGREYANYVVFDFFRCQLVCHSSSVDLNAKITMYPRHFGLILAEKQELDGLYERAKSRKLPFFEEMFERYRGKPSWHHSFFLIDPSNNLVEFKFYQQSESIFGR